MNKPAKARLCLLLFTLAAAACLLSACGKTGNPRPREISRSFVWQSVEAAPAGGCLDIYGVMSGVYGNLDEVVLELAEVINGQDCPGCPFIPKEQIRVRNLGETFNSTTGELRFSYCPTLPADAYRLRLVGINVFDTSRHAVSKEIFVTMP